MSKHHPYDPEVDADLNYAPYSQSFRRIMTKRGDPKDDHTEDEDVHGPHLEQRKPLGRASVGRGSRIAWPTASSSTPPPRGEHVKAVADVAATGLLDNGPADRSRSIPRPW